MRNGFPQAEGRWLATPIRNGIVAL